MHIEHAQTIQLRWPAADTQAEWVEIEMISTLDVIKSSGLIFY